MIGNTKDTSFVLTNLMVVLRGITLIPFAVISKTTWGFHFPHQSTT